MSLAFKHRYKSSTSSGSGLKFRHYSTTESVDITTMPVKGDLIIIENKVYRVMSIDGTTALLMSNFNVGKMAMNSKSLIDTVSFGSDLSGPKYASADCDIDEYLNSTYYNSLSSAMQSAIVPTNIKQSMYYVKWGTEYSDLTAATPDGTVYSAGKIAEVSIEDPRKIFVLDLDDIAEYYGWADIATSSMLGDLFGDILSIKTTMWIRSATDISTYLRCISYVDTYGYNLIFSNSVSTENLVVPAFYIDLSKVEWMEGTRLIHSTRSTTAEVSSATSLTSSVQANVGDLVVAAIVTRDTLSLSDGWTLVSISEVNSNDTSGNGQRLSWAYKIADSTSETITVTQASAQRLYINMISMTGPTGVTDNGYSYDNTGDGTHTVTKPSGTVLWGMTAPLWDTSDTHGLWTSSPELNIIQLGTSTQSRLGIALDSSDTTEVTFTASTNDTTIIIGCLGIT